jgi:ankyrin repeat protein
LTPLHLAVQNNRLNIFKFLSEEGAILEKKQIDHLKMLHYAARNGDFEIFKSLVGRGANIETKDNIDFYTPLHVAAEKGHLEIFEFLIEKGADLLAVTKTGQSVVHLASHPSIIRSFKKFTKNKEHPQEDANGKYPIHYAAENGFAKVVDYLVSTMDYDVDQQFKDGKTALQYALESYKKVQYDNFRKPEMESQSTKFLEVVQILLQHGATVTQADKDMVQNEVIQLLLFQGTQLIHPNLPSMILSGEFDSKIAIKNTSCFYPDLTNKDAVIFCPLKSLHGKSNTKTFQEKYLERPERATNTVEDLPGSSRVSSKESLNILKEFDKVYTYLEYFQLKVFCDVPFQESNDALYKGFGKKETQDQPWPTNKNAGNLTIIVQENSIILLDEFYKNDDLEDHFRKLEAAKKIISDLLQIAFDYAIPDNTILKKLCFSEDDFIDMFIEADFPVVDNKKLTENLEKVKTENVEILMLIGEQKSQNLSPHSFWKQFYEKDPWTLRTQHSHHELKGSRQLRSLFCFLRDNRWAQREQVTTEKYVTEFQQNVIAGIVSLYFQSSFETAQKTKQQSKLCKRMEIESGNKVFYIMP